MFVNMVGYSLEQWVKVVGFIGATNNEGILDLTTSLSNPSPKAKSIKA
jgi:hypothetical protein